jgi:hypothetical protein
MRKKTFAVCGFSAFLIGLLSCRTEPGLKESSTFESGSDYSNQSNKNNLLSGRWVIQHLDIPDCKLCEESQMKLNKMWNEDLNIKDTFMFTKDSMFYKSVHRQSLAERFVYRDTVLSLIGSDWSYTMNVRKYAAETLTIAIGQQYVSEINSTEGRKYLVVTLAKAR